MKDYSQHGESTLINGIVEKIGTLNKYGVEFGASDGYWFSNLRMFLDSGWKGLQMEGEDKAGSNGVVKEFITKENINSILNKYGVPEEFDLLSIDIDGNDYWVWKEIDRKPNIVVIEYNSNFDKITSVALEYDVNNSFDGSHAYSASFKALCSLAEEKGYYLYEELGFNNLIFVRKEFQLKLPSIYNDESLKLPEYQHGRNLGNKKFIEV